MLKTGPKDHSLMLLRLWVNQEDNFKSFTEIVEEAKANKQLRFRKRTVINYLNVLVRNKKLEKRIESDRKTYYKPLDKAELFRQLAISAISMIEAPQAISFLCYLLQNFSAKIMLNSLDADNPLDLESLNRIFETAKEHSLALERSKNQWKDAVKELGFQGIT